MFIIGPDLESMGVLDKAKNPSDNITNVLAPNVDDISTGKILSETKEAEDDSLDTLDDDEIDYMIMTPNETKHKTELWHKLNANYLEEQRCIYFHIFHVIYQVIILINYNFWI